MKRHVGTVTILLLVTLRCGSAAAWFHAGAHGTASGGDGSWSAHSYRGGSASGSDGSWSASGFRGGSASGSDGSWNATGYRGGTAGGSNGQWYADGAEGGKAWGGDGSWKATGAYGGSASGGDGSWHATNSYGTTVYGGYNHYYGGTYTTYHPPVVVNSYYGSGCYDCGGWNAGGAAATGFVLGRLAGAASASAAPTYAVGSIYTTLPAGCVYSTVGGSNYYNCNGTWFSPSYGANGVYYRCVLPPPPP